MRIYYIIDSYVGPSAGTEKQLRLLAEGMLKRGHEVRLFVLRETSYTRGSHDFPCPIGHIGIRSISALSGLMSAMRFRARIHHDRPDVVHAFFNDAAILAPIFFRARQTRVFTSRRDIGFWYTRSILRALRVANRRVDSVICNCHAVAESVHVSERLPWEKLTVIYNGLELGRSHPKRSVPECLLSAGYDARDTNVAVVANLRPLKRIQDLIEAAAIVKPRAPRFRFWIVGAELDAEYAERLRDLVVDLDLKESVSFLGASEDPTSVLEFSNIGVLTSESEGLSNTILEYMGAGLPVVCSDVGGSPELVRNSINGLLYPPGDVSALSARLLELYDNQTVRAAMGNAATRLIKNFSADAFLASHEAAYLGSNLTSPPEVRTV